MHSHEHPGASRSLNPEAHHGAWDLDRDLLYDEESDPPQVRGGTLPALVKHLTRPNQVDPAFNDSFLLTYHCFTSASALFDLLVARFNLQVPYGICCQNGQAGFEEEQRSIHYCVVDIIKTWLENHWMERQDEESRDLILRIHDFVKDSIIILDTPEAHLLFAVVKRRLVLNGIAARPEPLPLRVLGPANAKKPALLKLSCDELASQLTLLEFELLKRVNPVECLKKAWQTEGEHDSAPNIRAIITHSLRLSNWVAMTVLKSSRIKDRILAIKHFVLVAKECRRLNNFASVLSIISAFNITAIAPLTRMWQSIDRSTSTTLEEMRSLMASTRGFYKYRQSIRLAEPPCVPLFGMLATLFR